MVFALNVGPGASAAERLALVIGNGAYGSLGRLPNPVSDANLIADALRRTGFAVTLVTDADEDRMKRAIVDFGRRLRAAPSDAVGLFYYAGHGVQSRGRNFLLPVQVDIRDEADLDIEAVQAGWVLRQMESAGNAINVVVLDACRNNPFARSFRSVERGLARMSAPTGSFVAYATAPGDVAADGSGRNSPYSAALADAILTPGLPIEQAFKKVRVDVLSATGGQQTPWESSSLTGNFYFNRDGGAPAPALAARPPRPLDPASPVKNATREQSETDPTPEPLPESQVAVATPQLPTSTRTQMLNLTFTLAFRSVNHGNCVEKGRGSATVSLDPSADPTKLNIQFLRAGGGVASNNRFPDFFISARRQGAGALVTLWPVNEERDANAIEVQFDALQPGTSETEYSSFRLPKFVNCGGLIAYATVAD